MMRRAGLVAGLVLAMLSAPLLTHAQQARKVPRIGYLSVQPPNVASPFLDAFREGLRDLGYVEGRSVVIEYRWAEGEVDRLPALAAELVRLNVDVLVAVGSPASLAAKHATATIPIVSVYTPDPVGLGLVASLARPGGNVTGLSAVASEYVGKLLELLKQAVPHAGRVAVLGDPGHPAYPIYWRELGLAARTLRVALQAADVRNREELESAFSAMTRAPVPGGIVVVPDTLTISNSGRIANLAAKSRLPAVFGFQEAAAAGGLMGYGPRARDLFHRAATYVDKILKGARPADLPVEQPTRFELVINLKTAKALGLRIPQSLLLRSDQVIE
jgi:putative ABC transport system substrate-binding protein